MTWMLLLAAIAVGIVATPSRANEPVEVSIESLTPQMLDRSQPDQLITITGTVRNTTDQVVENASVHFWHSTKPITEHAELEQVLTPGATQPQGSRVTNSKENYQDLGELSPGASVKFTVSATTKELALSSKTDAAYLFGALVRSNSSTQGPMNVGRGRAFAVATKKPLQVSTIVKLTARPTLLDNTDFQDNSLESRLVGELSKLLEEAEKPETYTLLDPSLLVEAQVLAGEHTVAGQAAAPSETASNFVSRIKSLISTGRVMRLPFGNPNLARLHAAGDLSGFEAALGWSETALQASGLEQTISNAPLVADLNENDSQDLALTLALHGFQKVFGNNFISSGEISTTNHDLKAHALRISPMDLPGISPGNTFTGAQISGRRLAEGLLGGNPTIHMIREAKDITRAELLAGSETPAPLPEPSGQARYEVPKEQTTSWPKLRSQVQGIFDSTPTPGRVDRNRPRGPERNHRCAGLQQRFPIRAGGDGFRQRNPERETGPVRYPIERRQPVRDGIRDQQLPCHDQQSAAHHSESASAVRQRLSQPDPGRPLRPGDPRTWRAPNGEHLPVHHVQRCSDGAGPTHDGAGNGIRFGGAGGDHGHRPWASRLDHHRHLGCSSGRGHIPAYQGGAEGTSQGES